MNSDMDSSNVERRFVYHGKVLPDKVCLTGILNEEGFKTRLGPSSSGKTVTVFYLHDDGARIDYSRTQTSNFGTDKFIASGNAETVSAVMKRIEETYAKVSKKYFIF